MINLNFRKSITLIGVIIGAIACVINIKACKQSTELDQNFDAPLLSNLGNYSLDITTSSDLASKFFTQGIIMANGFNHAEAARSFKEAVKQDTTCAIAHWGVAYVLGPNYNTDRTEGNKEIYSAVNNAVKYAREAQPWERALIHAMQKRYPTDGTSVDENAYADAMRKVYEEFPENDFIVTLYAESMMNLHAWDLYTRKGGEPKPWTPLIVSTLELAIQLNNDNPLANHLYLHATEAAPDVEKALTSAERLKALVPGAGHLVHMPSHIYINTGDYHEGSIANENAVRVDSIYIAQCKSQGVYPQLYYPHNWHFLAATAALEGRATRSIEAAFKTAEIIDQRYLQQDGFSTTQHYITIPQHVLVKFSQWEKIKAMPKPNQELVYPTAIWHYARGMAFANTQNLAKAVEELEILKQLGNSEELKDLWIWEINTAADICAIASHVLEGEIAVKSGELESAVGHFQKAVAIEDQLNYNEPPDWFFSVRHLLGNVLLELNRGSEAELVFREDLSYWVKNGYALNGLHHSLLQQGKNEEAKNVSMQFIQAWQYADIELKYSRIDESKRKDLAIQLNENTATDLVYLAGTFCFK